MTGPSLRFRASLALYRLLLRMYPIAFRSRFERAMTQDFYELLCTETVRHGRLGCLRAWRRALSDLIRSFMRERLAGSRTPRRRPRGAIVSSLFVDFRYAVRSLGRAKGFTTAAVVTLAVGIGANTAIFAIIHAFLLRPLPYPEPNRLAVVYQHHSPSNNQRNSISPAFFRDMEAQNDAFTSIAAWYVSSTTVSGPEGDAEYVLTGAVTAAFFDVLRIPPIMGRTFRPEDAEPGMHRVILGEAYWRGRFAAAPDIIGRTVIRNRVEYEIIGVAPASVELPRKATMWTVIPNEPGRWDNRGSHYLTAVARLKPGTSLTAARANLEGIAQQASQDYPHDHVGWGVSLFPLHADLVHDIRPALVLLQGAALVVLLIACVNVANLQLARNGARAGEYVLRTALGAGRLRIAQQVLVESLLLAGIGSGAGLAIAVTVVGALRVVAPANLLDMEAVRFDPIVATFTAILAIGTSLVFGISPALRSASSSSNVAFRQGSHRASGGGRRFREVLVTIEVALSLVLLAGAALLLNSFARLIAVDPGIDPQHLLTAHVAIPGSVYSDPIDRARFFRNLHEAAGRVSGVESASLVSTMPLSGTVGVWSNGFRRPDLPPPAPGQGNTAMLRWISPEHLATVGLPLLRGRTLTYADTEDSPNVVLIDQTMADRFFPGEDPVGKRLLIHYNEWEAQIIGIVGNAKQASLDEALEPHMYVSYWQTYTPMYLSSMSVTMRTTGDPQLAVGPFRDAVASIDPLVVPTRIETFEDHIAQSVAPQRFNLLLVLVFAIMAAFLSVVGLYGVIAYLVSQRTREIGIRVALGAQKGNILALILGHGLMITTIGLVIGLFGVFATQRLLAQFLYQVNATDPLTIVAVCGLLGTIATAATLLPARRAAKLDPVTALR